MKTHRILFLSLLAGTSLAAQTNTFPSSGNVGIGTTSPSAMLHVLGTSTGTNVPVGIFDKSYGTAGDTATAIRVNLNAGAGGGYLMGYSGDFSISHNVEYISGTGYVARQATASQVGQQAGNIYFNSNSGLTAGSAFTPTARMYIQASSGNVGIGTTSPQTKLQISDLSAGSTDQELLSLQVGYSTNSSKKALTWRDGTNITGQIDTRYNGTSVDMVFGHLYNSGYQSGDILTIKGTGNVGIGTTSIGSYKLAVEGAIRARSVVVDNATWPDYVFKPGYKLPSLSEVEGAIQRDGHLPGIPSAAEVAQGGVSLGDMQAKLLAKVEELTLHQIAQEKRIELLEQENNALRSKSSQL